jgi:hypothetical protein
MLPADIARIIDVTRKKLLGGVVIDAADIENQNCIALGEVKRCQPV